MTVVIVRCRYQRGPEGEPASEDTFDRFPMRAAVRIQEFLGAISRLPRSPSFTLRSRVNSPQKSRRCVREGFHKCLSLFVYEDQHRRKDRQGVGKRRQELVKAGQEND